MNTGNTWLDGMHNHGARLNRIASQLGSLSNAFARTGNMAMAEELFEVEQALLAEAKNASDLTTVKVNGDYREAVQGSANVLKACLAGLTGE